MPIISANHIAAISIHLQIYLTAIKRAVVSCSCHSRHPWVGEKLLVVPSLPYTEIITQFERLRLGAEGPRKELAEYIASQWIYNAIFPVKDWSVFMQPVRTNNDIEGWHHALNRRASGRCSLPFYVLIQLLNREARLVEVHMRLVADHKLTLIQRGNIAFCRPNCRISGSSTCYSPLYSHG